MKFLSNSTKINRPIIYLNGLYPMDVVSGNIMTEVGGLSRCVLTIPAIYASDLEESDEGTRFRVTAGITGSGIGEDFIFDGYLTGIGGGGQVGQLYCQATLLHSASVLDKVSMSGPGLVPGGISDYSYILNKDTSQFKDAFLSIDLSDNLAKQIIQRAIIPLLKRLTGVGSEVGKFEDRINATSVDAAINYLNSKVKYLGAVTSVPISGSDLNYMLQDALLNSPARNETVWNCLSSIFSQFGIVMTCAPGGELYIGPDLSGMAAHYSNIFSPDNIISFNVNSSIVRNISQVVVVDSDPFGVKTLDSDGDEAQIKKSLDSVYTVGRYPQDPTAGGGVLVLKLPSWIQGAYDRVRIGQPKYTDAKTTVEAYAKMLFINSRNQSKNASLVTPLAPKVMPGTTAKFMPYSEAKVIKGGGHPATPLPPSPTYIGYIFAINHSFSAEGGEWRTEFGFKNVTTTGKNDFASEHPFYSNARPFALE